MKVDCRYVLFSTRLASVMFGRSKCRLKTLSRRISLLLICFALTNQLIYFVSDRFMESDDKFMERMKRRMNERKNLLHEKCKQLAKLYSKHFARAPRQVSDFCFPRKRSLKRKSYEYSPGFNKENRSTEPWEIDFHSQSPWFVVAEKQGLVYCEIPKSGSTNWKKVFMVLKSSANSTSAIRKADTLSLKNIALLSNVEVGKIAYKGRKLLKMISVRDPIERLASAYQDKLLRHKPYISAAFPVFTSEIARKYGQRWEDPTKDLGNGVREITACLHHVAILQCNKTNEVISVTSAVFGRTDLHTCLGLGEHKTLTKKKISSCAPSRSEWVVSQLCDGKNICRVVVSSASFNASDSCGDFPSYLYVTYQCKDLQKMDNILLCGRHFYSLQCSHHHYLHIGSAFYGRKDLTTCSAGAEIYDTDCTSETATSAVFSACNGKTSCLVQASERWIQSDSCPYTTKKYLQIWYQCKKEPPRIVNNFETKFEPPPIFNVPKYRHRFWHLEANFNEFVSYLVDPKNSDVTHDVIDHGSKAVRITSVRHWKNYHTLCQPCHLDYDVIAHMETIDEDARHNPTAIWEQCFGPSDAFKQPSMLHRPREGLPCLSLRYILKLINAPEGLTYPRGYQYWGGRVTTPQKVNQLLSQLKPKVLLQLFELYRNDFELFGYSVPEKIAQLHSSQP